MLRPFSAAAIVGSVSRSNSITAFLLFLLAATTHSNGVTFVHGYAGGGGFGRRDMAGLWRLSGVDPSFLNNDRIQQQKQAAVSPFPMKEFTVYPKKENSHIHGQDRQQEMAQVLIMLSEDGSFQQYDDDYSTEEEDPEGDDDDVDDDPKGREHHTPQESASAFFQHNLNKQMTLQQRGLRLLKGTWDFLDGKLILASDRLSKDERDTTEQHDTILVGQVVATSEYSLVDNPALLDKESKMQQQQHIDTHLSIPQGKVEIGKFMYPRKHRSFFEQPIYQPTPNGSFSLKQVLGALNAGIPPQQEASEKFKKEDFWGDNKKFVLTCYPMKRYKPKGELRWSIKQNKFVRDVRKQTKEQIEQARNDDLPLHVLEVALFTNNTFSTVRGLGNSTVLRGKWDITGQDKDHLWMQVSLFGIGKSQSGSTFSEGKGLTHNDEKTYLGRISYAENGELPKEGKQQDQKIDNDDDGNHNATDEAFKKRIEVKGFEPEPVGRFIMHEATKEDLYDDYDEEDDDDDDEKSGDDGGLLDWSNSFQ